MRATKGEHAFLIRSCLSVIYVLRILLSLFLLDPAQREETPGVERQVLYSQSFLNLSLTKSPLVRL